MSRRAFIAMVAWAIVGGLGCVLLIIQAQTRRALANRVTRAEAETYTEPLTRLKAAQDQIQSQLMEIGVLQKENATLSKINAVLKAEVQPAVEFRRLLRRCVDSNDR